MDKTSLNAFIQDNIYGTIIFKKYVVVSQETFALVVNRFIYFGIHCVSWNSDEGKFKVNKITTTTKQSDAIKILITIETNIEKFKSRELFAHADVVRCSRKCYYHFAIYDKVRECFYEYQQPVGDPNPVKICQTSGYEFMLREYFMPTVVNYQDPLPDAEVIGRARSNIGVKAYNAVFNNCEHFATWCKLGIPDSAGVNSIIANVAGGTKFGFGVMIINSVFGLGNLFSAPLSLIVGAGVVGLGLVYAVNSRKETPFD
jgi:hypothetical protein